MVSTVLNVPANHYSLAHNKELVGGKHMFHSVDIRDLYVTLNVSVNFKWVFFLVQPPLPKQYGVTKAP